MNISKNLFKKIQICYLNNTFWCKRGLNVLSFRTTLPNRNHLIKQHKFMKRKSKQYCSYNSSNITELEEVTSVYPFVDNQPLSRSEQVRRILFKRHNDSKVTEIGKCASVEEVFNFVRDNIDKLNYEYLTQIVLSLYDLQNIFIYHYEEEDGSELRQIFFKKLLEHQEFYMVTKAIDDALKTFDPLFLSYTILYLNKLGISEESQLIQDMALTLRDHLLNDFSLNNAVRLLRVIFSENSVRPYYIVLDLIPNIFDQIELVGTTEDLKDLTICLHKLNSILTDHILIRFETKINQLIKDNILCGEDYHVILKIILLFNFPKWRNKHCSMISKCILLMKNSLESLNLVEMCHIYDVFFKIQEPGDALNAIQRAAAKLLHEIDDSEANQKNKLRLFSSVIYFSSPINKGHFRSDIKKYMSEKETFNNLLTLRKIHSYLKISDTKLYDAYWNKAIHILKEEKDFDKITRFMENYLYFCGDLNGFRHHAFEHYILTSIKNKIHRGTMTIFPNNFFPAFIFALVSSYNTKLLENLLQSFNDLSSQLKPIDIFKVSHGLQVLRQRNSIATPTQITQIKNILNNAAARIYAYPNVQPAITGLLVKSAIIRKDSENELVNDMLTSLKDVKYMSSKIMEYMCFNTYATNALIPEIINLCTEYIVHNKSGIMGFNVEKMLYALYRLNYQPVYEDNFFGTAIDIIIRDKERMSGLGFLHSALSLCFFNRMPKSFIKQIFNVEFLDKLDVELANCYFRDIYPQRVRHALMELNRAVCLEYPEYNVPWFHHKYIEEFYKTNAIDDLVTNFHRNVKGYLISIMGKASILENVSAPYGYEINFVLHLDKDKKPTNNFNDPYTTKLALLLKHESAFTRFYVRLKGKHALKNRHLEILGYKVKMIQRNEWSNLLYAKEKVDYIEQVIFS